MIIDQDQFVQWATTIDLFKSNAAPSLQQLDDPDQQAAITVKNRQETCREHICHAYSALLCVTVHKPVMPMV